MARQRQSFKLLFLVANKFSNDANGQRTIKQSNKTLSLARPTMVDGLSSHDRTKAIKPLPINSLVNSQHSNNMTMVNTIPPIRTNHNRPQTRNGNAKPVRTKADPAMSRQKARGTGHESVISATKPSR